MQLLFLLVKSFKFLECKNFIVQCLLEWKTFLSSNSSNNFIASCHPQHLASVSSWPETRKHFYTSIVASRHFCDFSGKKTQIILPTTLSLLMMGLGERKDFSFLSKVLRKFLPRQTGKRSNLCRAFRGVTIVDDGKSVLHQTESRLNASAKLLSKALVSETEGEEIFHINRAKRKREMEWKWHKRN